MSVDANDVRRARLFLLLHPDDCDPPHGLDLQPGGRDEAKVEHLAATFKRWGFSLDAPVLVGYALEAGVTLEQRFAELKDARVLVAMADEEFTQALKALKEAEARRDAAGKSLNAAASTSAGLLFEALASARIWRWIARAELRQAKERFDAECDL